MELTERQKMLGFALKAHGVSRENIIGIMMVLNTDEEIDDLTWYMGQHPNAPDEELLAVAYQLVEDSKDGNNEQ